MKLLKSKKALSPVVAAIILIAVTVAVSIAVAAWMGALTFTFMGTEKVEIKTVTWSPPNQVTLRVENTGTKAVTITGAKVNYGNVPCSMSPSSATINTGSYADITITFTSGYANGTVYDLTVVTSDGHEYTRTATGGQNIT
ncbi:MAG: Ig-like domain-containing protein [Candidatus Bathyarchaeaceae archaeon]